MSVQEPEELISRLNRAGTLEDTDISLLDFDLVAIDEPHFVNCFAADARFVGGNLGGSRWRNCHFVRCEFVSTKFDHANFENCKFFDSGEAKGCTFRYCDLSHVQFVNCDLSLAELAGCDIFEISISTSRVRGAVFERCKTSRSFGKRIRTAAKLSECDFVDASLVGVDLTGCNFQKCDLSGANLSGAELVDCDMLESNLSHVDLHKADLSGADLRGCRLDGFQLPTLRAFQGVRVSASEQHHLLQSIGVEVSVDADR
jgi:fluoroquinolone resistance protein